MPYTLKKYILPATKDKGEVTFSFNNYTYPGSAIQYVSISVLLIFIYLIKASCFFQRRAIERKIGLLIFSEADAFLSWALSELGMIYILVFSKKALYFPIISLLALQFQSGKTFIYQAGEVKHIPILFSRLGSFFSQLFVSDGFEKQRQAHSNKWAALCLFHYVYFFFLWCWT